MRKNRWVFTALLLCLAVLAGCADKAGDAKKQSGGQTNSGVSAGTEPSSAEPSEPATSSEPAESADEQPQSLPSPESEESAAAEANANKTSVLSDDFSSLDTQKQGWGPGLNVNAANRPVSAEQFQEKYGKYGAVFIKPDDGKIYLTFDEGYENGYTAQILDVLKEKRVHAVFFVTYDYVSKNHDLVRRMIDEGHAVGNHTWSHPSLPTLGVSNVKEEITKLHDYVRQEFQYTMTLLRPPMGEFSEQTLAVAQSLGYQTVEWSFAYRDWETDNQPDPAAALEKIVSSAHGGGVYLLHAVSSTNTQILGEVIDRITAGGRTFALLS